MPSHKFLDKHGIVRNAMRKDLLYFGIPAILVLFLGLVACGNRLDGLWATLWDVVRHPSRLSSLSLSNRSGLALFVGGLTFAIVAVGTLRNSYSSTLLIRKDHKLVTRGIYRFTRHPVYLGVLIGCIGLPVYASSPYGVVIMAVLIPIFLNRIRMEEALLTEEFGEAYRTYRERTSKLIPFIY